MYPNCTKNKYGKLRLLYEANSIAAISEQAGEKAVSGDQRIFRYCTHRYTPTYSFFLR